MKKLLFVFAGALFVFAGVQAATLSPVYISGTNSAYAWSQDVVCTDTNLAVPYTFVTVGITNVPTGTNGESFTVSWRGTSSTFYWTNTTPAVSTHWQVGTTTTNTLFDAYRSLQGLYPTVLVGDYVEGQTFTISAPTNDVVTVSVSGGFTNSSSSTVYHTATTTNRVNFTTGSLTLRTNTVIYVSDVVLTNAELIITYGTNTIISF